MDVAIVIPVYNQLGHTQECLRCLAADIADGVRVIVVNNGSTDGTRAWLATRRDITVIENETNRGCAPAWNQGCKAAIGADWIIVLNNDVLLPPGWRSGLLDTAKREGWQVACPAMREGPLNYDFEEHATRYRERMSQVIRPGHAHGVCFAVAREVFDTIGGFDEAFRIGQFEDADFFRRTRRAGFRLGTTGACFIHHFGSTTQKALRDGPPTGPYEAENRAHFRKKWKLGWFRRRWERWRAGARNWRWRTMELISNGHTLHEKGFGETLRFY